MSIEYTIDIQLTELGFPTTTLDPLNSSDRETPCRSTSPDDTSSPSHPPTTTCSTSYKQKLLVTGHECDDGKEAGGVNQDESFEQRAVNSTSPLLIPAQSLQAEPDVIPLELPVPALNHLTSRPELLQQAKKKDGSKKRGSTEEKQDDSDDSDVSVVYEDEALDEEDEDEEELNPDSSKLGDYSCSVCGLHLPCKLMLQDHMNLHTGDHPYYCTECGKRFRRTINYRNHLRKHAQTERERFKCRVCRKDFTYHEDLKYHLAISHWEDKYYECDHCKRVFTSLEACQYHVTNHQCLQKEICERCGGSFPSSKHLARHKRDDCHNVFRCTECKKIFIKKNSLLKHSFTHLGVSAYTCVRCHCHFRLPKLYLLHKCEPKRIHCVACLREFFSQKDFQQHKKDTGCWGNQGPKGDEIRCLECGQMFDTLDELKKHAGAHQRVLKCAECGKGFRSALLLMSHMGGHAGKSPCLCQSCGLGFPHQQNYNGHLKTCGQTPQPKSSAKKSHASKRTPSGTTSLNTKPEFKAKQVRANKKLCKTSAVPKNINPAEVTHNSAPVTEDMSASVNPSSGLWKITLDRPLPPASDLVFFLPVCATQTDGLALPSVVSQTPAAPAMQVQSQVPFPLVSHEHLGVSAALGPPLDAPLDMVTGIKQDPICDLPFDLSMKSSKSAWDAAPLLPVKSEPVKSEPEELKIPIDAYNSTGQELKHSNVDPYHEVKCFKTDPMDLSISSGLVKDIKKEAS
ncbi:zinc finger protein 623 [Notolabrus celidotus]|uniref:zinc finger protein 623 n=1 Tax=Notolabrus celidotus TaxID=1203425 RepID=UPI00148FA1A5|nr:zinc finger protein 623 [Notolabrus celidotus]XP_034552815.1 zinc finger protein 623 [Notolabrus celidotus]